jgi:hypothetical protein
LLPHLASLRGLGRLFSLRALTRLEVGDAAPALQDALTTIRLPDVLIRKRRTLTTQDATT